MSELEFQVHQEEDEIASAHLGRVAAGSFVVGAAGVFFAGLLLTASTGSLRPSAAGPGGTRPGPSQISGVRQSPVRDTRAGLDLRLTQKRELEGWGWSDRDAGIATIPIDHAIDVTLREVNR
jgi:hypothetical protein